jgi:hypothetical protein
MKRNYWTNTKSLVCVVALIAFIWITFTDDIRLRVSVRSKAEAVTADDIAARIADCITHELGAYDDS